MWHHLLGSGAAIGCACLICVSAAGCGESATHSHSKRSPGTQPSATTARQVKFDRDLDTDTPSHDTDTDDDAHYGQNNAVNGFGHSPTRAEQRAIVATVERFHAATAAKDGKNVCALLDASLVTGLAEEAPSAGTSVADRCGAAVVETLAHLGSQSDAGQAKVDVTRVRVQGKEARALVYLSRYEERYVPLLRRGHAWKVDTLFDLGV